MKSVAYRSPRAASLVLLLHACVPAGVPDEASGSGLAPAPTNAAAPPQAPPEGSTVAVTNPSNDDPCATFRAPPPVADETPPPADEAGIQQAALLVRSIATDGINRAAEWLDAWPRTDAGWHARLMVARAMYPGSAVDALVPADADRHAMVQYVLQQLNLSGGPSCANEAAAWIRLLVWPLGSARSGAGSVGATLDQAVNASFDVCGAAPADRARLILAIHDEARMLALQAGPDARLAMLRALQNVVAVRFGAATEWTEAVDVQLLHTLAGMTPDGCAGGPALNGQPPEALQAIADSLLALTPATNGSTGDLYSLAPSIALALQFAAGTTDGESVTVWAARAVERGLDPQVAAVSARRLQAAVDAARENRALTEASADLFAPTTPPTDRQERLILQGILLWEAARSGNCDDLPQGFERPDEPLAQLMSDLVWGHSGCRDSGRPWHPHPSLPAEVVCALSPESDLARLIDAASVSTHRSYYEFTPSMVPNVASDTGSWHVGMRSTGASSCLVVRPALEDDVESSIWTPALPFISLEGGNGPLVAQQSGAWLRRASLIQFGSFETLGGGGSAVAQAARASTGVPASEVVSTLVRAGLPLTALQVDRARVQLSALTGNSSDGEPLAWSLRRADVPRMLDGVAFDGAIPAAHIAFLNGVAEAPARWDGEAAIASCSALVGAGFDVEANGVPPLFCDGASQAADFSECLRVAQACDAQGPLMGPDAVNLLLQSLRLGVGTGRVDEAVVAAVVRVLSEQTGLLPASLLVELRARLVQARWIQRDFAGLSDAAAATRSLFERAAGDARDWARVYGILEQLALVANGSPANMALLRHWSQDEEQRDLVDLVVLLEQSGDGEQVRNEAIALLNTLFTSDESFVPGF